MPDQGLISEARWLLGMARPAPWWISATGDVYSGEGGSDSPLVAENVEPSDASLIVFMRNAFGQLLDAHEVALARIAELERARTPVGYLVAHRDALAQWWAQESLWPNRVGAEADMQEIANDVPGADWRVLACFDDSGAPYRAGRRDA